LLAVEILVGFQSGIVGVPKLTGLFVRYVVTNVRALAALRMLAHLDSCTAFLPNALRNVTRRTIVGERAGV
jgi:hypothetical protein